MDDDHLKAACLRLKQGQDVLFNPNGLKSIKMKVLDVDYLSAGFSVIASTITECPAGLRMGPTNVEMIIKQGHKVLIVLTPS